jgi:hypothetical protein
MNRINIYKNPPNYDIDQEILDACVALIDDEEVSCKGPAKTFTAHERSLYSQNLEQRINTVTEKNLSKRKKCVFALGKEDVTAEERQELENIPNQNSLFKSTDPFYRNKVYEWLEKCGGPSNRIALNMATEKVKCKRSTVATYCYSHNRETSKKNKEVIPLTSASLGSSNDLTFSTNKTKKIAQKKVITPKNFPGSRTDNFLSRETSDFGPVIRQFSNKSEATSSANTSNLTSSDLTDCDLKGIDEKMNKKDSLYTQQKTFRDIILKILEKKGGTDNETATNAAGDLLGIEPVLLKAYLNANLKPNLGGGHQGRNIFREQDPEKLAQELNHRINVMESVCSLNHLNTSLVKRNRKEYTSSSNE